MASSIREWQAHIAVTLRDFDGAVITYDSAKKHIRLLIEYRGQRAVTFMPKTASDRRGLLNKVAEIRRILKNMEGV